MSSIKINASLSSNPRSGTTSNLVITKAVHSLVHKRKVHKA